MDGLLLVGIISIFCLMTAVSVESMQGKTLRMGVGITMCSHGNKVLLMALQAILMANSLRLAIRQTPPCQQLTRHFILGQIKALPSLQMESLMKSLCGQGR